MKDYDACVWIDHRQAKIFAVQRDAAEVTRLADHRAEHHIHRKADHVGLGTVTMDAAFLDAVAEALTPARAILIGGPGKAKTELAGHLSERYPALAKRVWGIEPMDHPTDGQLIAEARAFFKSRAGIER